MTTTTTSDMNTPNDLILSEQNDQSHHSSSMDFLSSKMSHPSIPRLQSRNYRKLLQEANVPAPWYQAPPPPCSIYFYDPQLQRYLQQQSQRWNSPRTNGSFITPRIAERPSNSRSSPRKNHLNRSNASSSFISPNKTCCDGLHDVPTRLKPVPTLPPIDSPKKSTK